MSHANAPLTPIGRQRLAALIIDQGRSVRRAAERFQVSPATAAKWARRYPASEPLNNRSSRPHHSPTRLPKRREHRIISLRLTRRWGQSFSVARVGRTGRSAGVSGSAAVDLAAKIAFIHGHRQL